MAQLKIVARFKDGRTIKGTTHNFWPGEARFRVEPPPDQSGQAGVEVAIEDLKALFIVHDLIGNPNPQTAPPRPLAPALGLTVRVQFKDGEVLIGSTVDFDAGARGFFLVPHDPRSNNIRAFVVNSAVAEVRPVPAGNRAAGNAA